MFETARAALYPVLPLRDIVVFPHMIVPLFVGREKSVRALEDVMKDDKQILLVTQKNAAQDDPATSDIYTVGTVGTVLQLLKLPDGTVKVLVEGGQRARIVRFADNEQFFQANAEVVGEKPGAHQEIEALARTVVAQFEQYIKLNKKIPPEVLVSINQIDDPGKLADTVASHLSLKIPEKQELLETEVVSERLEKVFGYMEGEIGVLQVEKRIRNRVKCQMEKTQREYYLNEQLKAIQKELGESVARATGRNFVRMSLGGVRDEAEIRGHRRTYIGSMPGKILQGMKKAKSSNPLFLLDEVDKLGADWRGDPSSALLEVLDPEQNSTFNDHYLEVDYDLSDVLFVTTADTLRMPQPLMDRMEIIRIPGYTEDEKVEIAKRHLIAKQIKAHGLKKGEWSISDDALRDLIRFFTREAGVRNLEREIANLTRKAIKDILMKKCDRVSVTRRNLDKYAGVRRFRFGEAESEDMVGVTTGLAWTEVGGELLTIEAVTLPGKGRVTATGKLGDVMKESVQAAESYVKARSHAFGIRPQIFEKKDIHVHVPEGATPKDGPSAGVGMVTSIVSVLTGIAVKRDIAMTGEITLRGRVLPIGGLKEKLLAALRGGLKAVLIPGENEKDLAEIPDNVKRGLKIIPVHTVDELLAHALAKPLTPIAWEEESEPPPAIPASGEERSGVVTH